MGNVELLQNPRWLPNCVTYIEPDASTHGGPPDHHTNLNVLWASISELWAMLLQNPRWLPNHATYIAPIALVHGGPPDYFTL